MSEPFLGQITLMACKFAPSGWAMCQGQLLPLSQYTALFSLLGTRYGGNGTTNFALPNLQGRVPNGMGRGLGLSDYQIGELGGIEAVTLTTAEVPPHIHTLSAYTGSATAMNPAGALTAQGPASGGHGGERLLNLYNSAAPNASLAAGQVEPLRGGSPHDNIQPSLALNWCIALKGIFPSRP